MPAAPGRAYPRRVATPSKAGPRVRAEHARDRSMPSPLPDPDGGRGEVHDLLTKAVEEAARLLEVDGAMVYLLDPETNHLYFAHDAGIRSARSRRWVRSINLPVGVGMFGRAVAERAVVVTGNYLADTSFRHADDPDHVVEDAGIESMVVAPMVSGDEVFGALGAFSAQRDAFQPAQVGLVRALADHAAAAMRNARLIEALDQSRGELAERADIERSLREIAGRISAAQDLAAVLQLGVDEAARLLHADGARIDLIDPRNGLLRWAYASGAVRPDDSIWPDDPNETLDQGVSGQAVVRGEVFWTGDYLHDDRFPHGHGADTYVDATDVRSAMAAPLTGQDGPFGALTVFTARPHAWNEQDAGLLGAIADQAAIMIRTTRLIEELDRSREALARRADAEQALREIAGRITALRDTGDILRDVAAQAGRLVGADGVILDLLDPTTGNLHWALDQGLSVEFTDEEKAKLWISVGVGATGTAVAENRVIVAGDDLASLFPPMPESTEFYARTGFRSMIAAPLTGESGPLGVIEVSSKRPDAFTAADGGLVGGLASQAAVALTNARLIDELARSRAELARTADAERTLREIAARVSAILDPAEVLQKIVDETLRLLQADGARIDLYDPEQGLLRWAYASGDAMSYVPDWAVNGGLKPGQAVAGTAFAERRIVRTDDYLADERFTQDGPARAFVLQTGIRSVIAVPLAGDGDPLGTLSVASRTPGAYDEADADVLAAFATQASIAIRNARLIDELGRSRALIERRATAEQALREIGARITAIREPGDLLQRIVDEALRLLRADGAVIDEFVPEEGVLVSRYDAGLSEAQRRSVRETRLHVGEGLSGKAVAERRVIAAGDYLAGDFVHSPQADEMARTTDIGDLIVAPIIGDEGPVGAIEVYSKQTYAFDEIDAAVLGGLADQAAIAITNARLIGALEASQTALARRADTERALRDITARIAALREPDVVLHRVVQEAKRLLGTDGAHLTRMSDSHDYLVPVVVAGAGEDEDHAWLLGLQFPLDGGINGLAATEGRPVWTNDYRTDPRIPHEEDDTTVAERLGLIGMAAAPLRAPGGEVIGTLAVSSAQRRDFDAEELDLLQGLADQAAIAITNSTLLTRLTESEARYRYLVERAPDLVWSIDAEGRLTFVSDAVIRLTGRRPADLLGQHFGAIVHESSRDVAEFDWTTQMRAGSQEVRGRLNLAGPDGEPVPAEFIAAARLDAEGRFLGANGSVRDMREQERLERELRDSEQRYRTLASSSPDLVFETDAEGRYTFVSDRAESVLGWDREEAIGRHFMEYVAPGWEPAAAASYEALVAEPERVVTSRIDFLRGDGTPTPLEINVVGRVEDGRLVAIQGVARDVSDRERLERELRESEARYRFLVVNSPDVVFATDARGVFTFMSDSMERMTGWRPDQLVGQHFSEVVERESQDEAASRWMALVNEPATEQIAHLSLRRPDGGLVPVEVSAIGMTDGRGAFAGIHGSARDIGERLRLEGELRRQAGELAAGEERAHLARELHDSVTQALFSMTLVSRSVEMLLERDLEGAKVQLAQLRELQREALAEMRALIFELRPGNLEQEGLIRALRTHTAAIQGRIGLAVVVDSTLDARLPLAVEEVLYRIAQEALHNVIKHAGARQVTVEVGRSGKGVRLRVRDDGRGFDPSRVPEGHLGLAGMRARADKIGARFSCTSEPGRGTTVEVEVPEAAIAAAGPVAATTPSEAIRDA